MWVLFLSFLSLLAGAPNGFPDDGPHPITAVPQMQGQPNSHSQGMNPI